MAGPPPLIPQLTQKDVQADDARFRRSNLGGDGWPTRTVFVVIVVAFAVWAIRFWIVGHSATSVPH